MFNKAHRPDPRDWAYKLREAAADLRTNTARSPESLSLANRLERYAESILFPQLPRWWADSRIQDRASA